MARVSHSGFALAALMLSGCGVVRSDILHDEQLDGPWRLVAIDTRENMIVCRRMPDVFCVGDMLGGPSVFAAGIDERYVVYARHPQSFPEPPRRDLSEYHYVIRTAGDGTPAGLRKENIKGPFDKATFEAERARLGLPAFSRVFGDLE